ncbi:hydantoinase B/oxoprolinase family protein [Microbacterium jejuense]|uniref:Hydantoinase B/oxoprolinase family protein n=1 Tax=Microbacterium jejuense TaxID=1263637 RepID=A0ABS7HMD6_9MICO|nr:hydantoinase B/oxoprolinase family protein [Microbacterium jejuense]MBW9093068.1 hydantoinase B/oxoprolinase family protein [Microbacterium jejuense]
MIDVITTEVIRSALESLSEQMTDTMERTSLSVILKEGKDCSSSLFDAQGRLMAEGANIPVHLNALGPCLKAMLKEHFPVESLEEGDVILTNDPYVGGSTGAHHTSDFIVYYPIFHNGQLIAFSTIFAHLAGAGGRDPEGWHETIFDEGLRIPPIKLYRRGELDEQLFKMILANTNQPYEQRGDILAQVAGARVGAQGLLSLIEKYSWDVLQEAIEAQIDYARERTKNQIARIPDGRYTAESQILEDGSMGGPFTIRLAVEVTGDEVHFDFTGTDPAMPGPQNCPMSATISATLFGLLALMPADIPKNEGPNSQIRITAPEGSLVNPRPPRAVYQRMALTHRIVDMIFQALAPALPDVVNAESCGLVYMNGTAINRETHPTGGDATGRHLWLNQGPSVGGLGASAGGDGLSAMASWMTNVATPSIEGMEIAAPVLYLQRSLRPDSGGAGKHRGGLGTIVKWKALGYDVKVSHTSQRFTIPAQGLLGGKPGATSRWVVNEGTDREYELPATGPTIDLEYGDTLTLYSPGGGGYGAPEERPQELIERDVRLGYVTEQGLSAYPTEENRSA